MKHLRAAPYCNCKFRRRSSRRKDQVKARTYAPALALFWAGKSWSFRLRFRGWLELALPRHEQLFVDGQVNPFFWLLRTQAAEGSCAFETSSDTLEVLVLQ
jgi:hypothetical protein